MTSWFVYAIGFCAQILFSSRLIVQWLSSEKEKKVITPTLFWSLSLMASFLLFIYGYLRNDFAIMLGQALTYFIYIRNLQLQNQWQKIHWVIRALLYSVPTLVIVYYFNNDVTDKDLLFHNKDIPIWLLWLGIISQIVFTLRFIYQWLYSEYKKTSSLPLGFWLLSLTGSILILIYAIIRKDPVLLIGHLLGSLIYIRNLILLHQDDH